jgi:hypothetical protein
MAFSRAAAGLGRTGSVEPNDSIAVYIGVVGPRSRESELVFGGINRHHRGRSAARNNLLREGTIAAAEIKPSKAFWNLEPLEKRFAYKTAPTAHHPLVRFSVGEKFVSTAHEHSQFCSGAILH